MRVVGGLGGMGVMVELGGMGVVGFIRFLVIGAFNF